MRQSLPRKKTNHPDYLQQGSKNQCRESVDRLDLLLLCLSCRIDPSAEIGTFWYVDTSCGESKLAKWATFEPTDFRLELEKGNFIVWHTIYTDGAIFIVWHTI